MTIGTVRWFDVRRGYGFLKPDDGGVDVLVDVCAVERAGMASLYQGQRLSFEVVYDKRIGSYAGIWVTARIKGRTFGGSRLRFRRGIVHLGRPSATGFVLVGAASFSPLQ